MEGKDLQRTKAALRSFIAKEFLPGEDPANLKDDTPLISGRILDSLATIRLIQYIEEQYSVVVRPEEMTEEYLDTIESIGLLIYERS